VNALHPPVEAKAASGRATPETLLDVQRRAFLAEGPPSAAVRRDRIDRMTASLLGHADSLAEAMCEDFGHRSPMQSLATDVLGILPSIQHTRAHLEKWMKPQRVNAGMVGWLGGKAWIQRQPLGVVGIISPWNFPVTLALQPLAQALAAGNRAMIKTSEFTPRTGELLAAVLAERFDAAEVAVITGGPEVGAAFSALPFDHLLFTGAPGIGRLVLRAAAEHLVPVTLELGGKSPVVIAPQANFAKAADRIAFGKTLNAGQLCLSPDYVYVPAGREREFAGQMARAIRQLFPRLLENEDYPSIINARHHQRLSDYLSDAKARGAELIVVNPANEDFANQAHHKLPPTLLLNVREDMKVMQDELFGPLLPIIGYRDLDEVISGVNARPRPLATYYFGPYDAACRRYLERTHSGGAVINDVILHATVEDLPFGGVGESGMGAYHGRAGFETFSHARGVVRAPLLSPNALMRPPYRRLEALFRWMIARGLRKADRRLHGR